MRKLIFLYFLMISGMGISQMTISNMIEQQSSGNFFQNRSIISLKQAGFVLLNAKSEYLNSQTEFIVEKYDSAFKFEWQMYFKPNFKYEFQKTFVNKTHLHFLFMENETTNIGVFRMNLVTGENEFFEGNLLTRMKVEQFKVLKNKAYIGGSYNDRPVIVAFNFHDLNSKILQDVHANHIEINNLEVLENKDQMLAFLKDDRNCLTMIKAYNYDGKLANTYKLGGRDMNLISSKVLISKTGQYFLVGNYSNICTEFAEGIYMLDLSDPKTENLTLMPFIKLNNFYNFMPKKQRERIQKRNENRENKGKNNNQKYKINLHEIYENGDENILIGEIYNTEFKANSAMIPSLTTNNLGQNYRFSHAVILGFDENGKILWDNSISLEGLVSNNLDQKVQLNLTNELNLLAYPKEGAIFSVATKKSEIIQEKQRFNLEENKMVKSFFNEESNLLAWYDNHFLVWGTQNIGLTETFYIKKLTYGLINGK